MPRTDTSTKKTNYHSFYFKVMVVLVGQVLAALVVLATVGLDPAEAAFPGANGKIAFASTRTTGTGVDNPTGDEEIFTMNPNGTGITQLTNNTVRDTNPSLSADGSWVVFTSNRDGNAEIYVMDIDPSTNDSTNLINNTVPDHFPDWSPDGEKIAFTSDRRSNYDIYAVNINTREQKRLTTNSALDYMPDWQPLVN